MKSLKDPTTFEIRVKPFKLLLFSIITQLSMMILFELLYPKGMNHLFEGIRDLESAREFISTFNYFTILTFWGQVNFVLLMGSGAYYLINLMRRENEKERN